MSKARACVCIEYANINVSLQMLTNVRNLHMIVTTSAKILLVLMSVTVTVKALYLVKMDTHVWVNSCVTLYI